MLYNFFINIILLYVIYSSYSPHVQCDIKRPLVWGFTVGYNWEKMSLFVLSLRKNGYKGDLVMTILSNMYENLLNRIEEYNILPILIENEWPFYSSNNLIFPLNSTFLKYCLIGKKNFGQYKWMVYRHSILFCWLLVYGYKYSHIVSLDVRDVVFQGNPFEWNFEEGLYVVDEIKSNNFFIKDNIYNFKWIQVFKNYNAIKNNKILNAGTIIGSKRYFVSFISQLCQYIIHSHVVTMDQGYMNYAYYTCTFKNIKFFMNRNQRGIVITTHLDLPAVIKLKRNNTIFNEDGTIPLIVHQYDRCKNYSKMYRMKYS